MLVQEEVAHTLFSMLLVLCFWNYYAELICGYFPVIFLVLLASVLGGQLMVYLRTAHYKMFHSTLAWQVLGNMVEPNRSQKIIKIGIYFVEIYLPADLA
jgi:hypothetical protein